MESAIRGVLHLRHVYRAISLSLIVAQKSSEIGQKIVGCGSWLNQFHALWPLVVDTPRILVVARGGSTARGRTLAEWISAHPAARLLFP